MRVVVVPRQPHSVPRFNGFAAFGETFEEHCSRVYADCPQLRAQCRVDHFGPIPFPAPWSAPGKIARGLPLSYAAGQCPGGSPQQQEAAAAEQQRQAAAEQQRQAAAEQQRQQEAAAAAAAAAARASLPAPAGGASSPPAQAPGIVDQLLANKPLLLGGGAVIAFFAWQALQRRGGSRGMNGYRSRKAHRAR